MSLQSQIRADRDFINRRGDRLNQGAEDRANTARQGRAANQAYADEVYDPLIGGRGGYNQDELDAIGGEQDFSDLRTRMEGDLQGNYLTGDEENSIRGNPWRRGAYFDADSEMADQRRSSDRQRGAVDQFGQDYAASIGGDELDVDGGYMSDMRGMVSGTASRMRGAADPTRLRASEGALSRIRMSPEEQQRIVTGAGVSAGVGHRAAVDDIERRSRAAGMNPAGAGAMRSRLERQAAVESGNAMTQARIGASGAAAQREVQAESMRMGGENSAADRVGQAEQAAGQFEYGARSGMEDRRMGAAQDRSSRRMQVAGTVGQSRIGAERDAASRETQSRQFNTTTGTEMATGIERDTAARAATVAGNRQQVNAANNQTRFGQTMDMNQARSQRAQVTGNARRADAQEGRGYIRSRIDQDQAAEQSEYNRQAGLYGTQGGLEAGNVNASIQESAQPRWWEKAISLGTGVAGTLLGTGGISNMVGGGGRRQSPAPAR